LSYYIYTSNDIKRFNHASTVILVKCFQFHFQTVKVEAQLDQDNVLVVETANKIVEEVERRMLSNLKGDVTEEILHKAYAHYAQIFDPSYGGFGSSPKFPTSHNLSFLALEMVEKTLDSMHRGGMYDHVGFGFSRYSVDEKWLVPHFEKMLYDNALLAWTYLEAYQLTHKKSYAAVAEQIFTYMLRDMSHPDGGFYCTVNFMTL
jgi:uncharacterized protein YyaL (SSP411 family)